MRLELVDDWREVALRSYSMWAVYLGIIILVGPEVWFVLTGYQIVSPYLLGQLGLALLVGGALGRLIKQPEIARPRLRRLAVFLLFVLALMIRKYFVQGMTMGAVR